MEQDFEYDKYPFLKELGIQKHNDGCLYNGTFQASGEVIHSVNPSTGKIIASVKTATKDDYEKLVAAMQKDSQAWKNTTMPFRGDIIRQIGEALRAKKKQLGALVSLEVGKIRSEGEGEVQEVIDLCDMACGLSRSLYGKVIPSERPDHMMLEVWNPIGLIGVITAFNFPNAVFGWNYAIGSVCGNSVLWKPAPSVPLVAIATCKIIDEVLVKNNCPRNILTLAIDTRKDIGELMTHDKRFPLISFTGSVSVGKIISSAVNARLGKTILELGGNNAVIIMDDANLELAFKACTFAAVGTCGQRCTSLRRLMVQTKVFDTVIERLTKAYQTVKIGDPLEEGTLCGPLHSKAQLKIFEETIKEAESQGGKVLVGGKILNNNFVQPTIIEVPKGAQVTMSEHFVPILFVFKIETLEEAIQLNNSAHEGLSSSLFTNDIKNAFKWIGPNGSDCGIVNVNIGPSGAEIGGAFGGEKDTGGGRESGSDSWMQYMKRQTCTINYGTKLPLAQGVKFDL